MQKGFPIKGLSVMAAATLLSGSAFAVGPTFEDDILPTVFVTDLTTSGSTQVVEGSDLSPAQGNIYRFDDALTLADYIASYGDGNAGNTLFAFTEVGVNVPASATIEINGQPPLPDNDPPDTYAEIDAWHPVDAQQSVSTPLDYENVVRTTGNPTPVAAFEDVTDLMFYIASAAAVDEVDVAGQTVITTNDKADGDEVSESTGNVTFTPVISWDTNFAAGTGFEHNAAFAGSLAFITDAAGSFAARTADQAASFTPATSPAPNGTGLVSAATPLDNDANDAGTGINAFWGSALAGTPAAGAYSVAAGDLLLIRWYVRDHLNIAAAQQESIRFRYGNASSGGAGTVIESITSPNAPYQLEAARIHNSWYYAATADNRQRLFLEALDLSDTGRSAFELSRVDVFRTQRSQISETVVYNQGGTVAGAPSGQVPFDTVTGDGSGWVWSNFFTGRPVTNTGSTTSQLLHNTTAAANRFNFARWATTNNASLLTSGQNITNAINNVTGNDLLFLDFYLSAPSATVTPDIRVGLEGQPLTVGGSNPRLTAYLSAATQTSNAQVTRPIGTTPQAYTLVYQPALYDPGTGAMTADQFDAILVFDAMLFDTDFNDAGTIRLDRVVVSTAPVPSMP